jgi:outer membrane protein TolC
MLPQQIKKTGLLLALSFFAMTASGLAAEPPAPLTLQTVLETAVQNNPTVIESQKRWVEKAARVPAASALPNPKIGVMWDDLNSPNPFDGSAMMVEYRLSQEIMNPAKLSAMGKMAQKEAQMVQANYQDKRMEIYAATKQAYYDLLYSGQALTVGKENQQIMGHLAQLAQINYSTGMVSLQDALRAQTEFSKMTTDLLNMAAMEAIARARLNTLMGRPADTVLVVAEEFVAPPPQFDLAALQKAAVESKPSVVGMQRQIEMAQSGVKLARAEGLPDFEVGLGYKVWKQEGGMDAVAKNDTWRIEIMAMIPLWHSKNSALVKSATAGLEASQASLSAMKNMAALDAQMAVVEAQSAWRRIELYKNTIVPVAEQTLQAGIVGYTNGKVDFMAALDSVNSLRNARLDYYKARVDYEKAIAALEKAIGHPLNDQPATLPK